MKMNLYLVHCGYYDPQIGDGLYESHVNYFVVADSFEVARIKAKEIPEFRSKSMHVDGLQEIQTVQGYAIELKPSNDQPWDSVGPGPTVIVSHRHRDLAPRAPTKGI